MDVIPSHQGRGRVIMSLTITLPYPGWRNSLPMCKPTVSSGQYHNNFPLNYCIIIQTVLRKDSMLITRTTGVRMELREGGGEE